MELPNTSCSSWLKWWVWLCSVFWRANLSSLNPWSPPCCTFWVDQCHTKKWNGSFSMCHIGHCLMDLWPPMCYRHNLLWRLFHTFWEFCLAISTISTSSSGQKWGTLTGSFLRNSFENGWTLKHDPNKARVLAKHSRTESDRRDANSGESKNAIGPVRQTIFNIQFAWCTRLASARWLLKGYVPYMLQSLNWFDGPALNMVRIVGNYHIPRLKHKQEESKIHRGKGSLLFWWPEHFEITLHSAEHREFLLLLCKLCIRSCAIMRDLGFVCPQDITQLEEPKLSLAFSIWVRPASALARESSICVSMASTCSCWDSTICAKSL